MVFQHTEPSLHCVEALTVINQESRLGRSVTAIQTLINTYTHTHTDKKRPVEEIRQN